MKKKFLVGILSFMLAVQPAAICQAEEVAGSEFTASETTDSETAESEAGSSEADESEPEGDSSATPVTGEDQTSVEDVEMKLLTQRRVTMFPWKIPRREM